MNLHSKFIKILALKSWFYSQCQSLKTTTVQITQLWKTRLCPHASHLGLPNCHSTSITECWCFKKLIASSMRLCVISTIWKIACLSRLSPPPFCVEAGEESVRVYNHFTTAIVFSFHSGWLPTTNGWMKDVTNWKLPNSARLWLQKWFYTCSTLIFNSWQLVLDINVPLPSLLPPPLVYIYIYIFPYILTLNSNM